jgi:hypothetical protein
VLISASEATFTTAVGEVKVVSLQRAVFSLYAASEGRLMDAFSESWGRRRAVRFACTSSVDGGDGGSSESEI